MASVKVRRRIGFTIVELMVVIAVIGILAAIATVSYTGAQNRAKRSNYDSTAQQVKLKLGEYYTDNGYYPSLKTGAGSVAAYLTATKSSELATEFSKAEYTYTPAPAGCTTSCQGYTIRVLKSQWNGGASDIDVTVVVEP